MATTRRGGTGEELRPRLLRLKDGARYLSVSVGTLRRLIQQGSLAVVKISDGTNVPWLVDQRDLDQFIEKTKVTL